MQNFVHLRVHSEYSITDSILKVNDIVNLAHTDNMVAVAITDLHNMFALIKFYKASRDSGVKPR